MKARAFMIMPFKNGASSSVYKNCIKPICEDFNLEIRRADEIFGNTPIYQDIVEEIQGATIIVVDITNNNPNVFYELGMAHTLKQNQTIIITNQDFSSTPFDIAHFRIIKYEDSIEGSIEFQRVFKNTLSSLLEDKSILYQGQFSFIFNLYESNEKLSELSVIPAIKFYNGVLNLDMSLSIDFQIDDKKEGMYSTLLSRKNIGAYLDFGYLKIENRLIILTKTGEAFASFLQERGFKIFKVNERVHEPGYVDYFSRITKRKKK